MPELTISPELTGKDLFDFLIANKSILIAEKKYSIKRADSFSFTRTVTTQKGDAVKANIPINKDPNTIEVVSIINTTNIVDSHKDLHIPGLWTKSLKDNKSLYLLQEHAMTFKGIITDDVEAYTQRVSWKSLGYDVPGFTEALTFNSKISKNRNGYMFDEYSAGHVKSHSVGMVYVKIELAVNDAEYQDEYSVWQKYIGEVSNKSDAEDTGYFWVVKEAKVIEGSAVPIGSNGRTPTLSVKSGTADEPGQPTHEQPQNENTFDVAQAIKGIKFFN